MLRAIAEAARYPEDSPAVEPTSEPGRSEWEDTLAVLADRRQELLVLFKNVSKLAPEQATVFLGAQLQQHLQPDSAFAVSFCILHRLGSSCNIG